jgi:hypothetical protein
MRHRSDEFIELSFALHVPAYTTRRSSREVAAMFQILCVEHGSGIPFAIATGFSDRDEAHGTARDWIQRRFDHSAYDHSLECWWLIDHGRTYKIIVEELGPVVAEAA